MHTDHLCSSHVNAMTSASVSRGPAPRDAPPSRRASAPLRLLLAELPDADVRRASRCSSACAATGCGTTGASSPKARWTMYLHDADDLLTIPGQYRGPAAAGAWPMRRARRRVMPRCWRARCSTTPSSTCWQRSPSGMRPGNAAPGSAVQCPWPRPPRRCRPRRWTQRLRLRRWPGCRHVAVGAPRRAYRDFISSRARRWPSSPSSAAWTGRRPRLPATLQEAGLLRVAGGGRAARRRRPLLHPRGHAGRQPIAACWPACARSSACGLQGR